MIQKQLNRIENLITCFGDYGHVLHDRLKICAINFEKLIPELLIENELIVRYPHVRYQIDLLKAQRFYSDRIRIKIILKHLLTNAFHFSSMSEDTNVSISIESNDMESILKVKNKGSYLEEASNKNFFHLFFHNTRSAESSGAGLFLVKEAVGQLSGSFNFINNPETGNTIQIKLPNFNTI